MARESPSSPSMSSRRGGLLKAASAAKLNPRHVVPERRQANAVVFNEAAGGHCSPSNSRRLLSATSGQPSPS
jgi:hypothetical protein